MKKQRHRRIAPIIILVLVVLIVGAASVIGYGLLSAGKNSKNKSENSTTSAASNSSSSSDSNVNNSDEDAYSLSTGDSPYLIKVNRAANCITIYSKDEDGHYSVPLKAIVCSTAKDKEDTPLGTFKTSEKYDWRLMVDGTYSQYAYRIEGEIMFHSVPYYEEDKDELEYEEYNKLGEAASLGCIRMTARDSKWIYDNCPEGTTVVIYDDAGNPGPLGKPESIKIPEDSEYSGWDPTDSDPDNPWLSCSPIISNVYDLTLKTGSNFNLLKYVKAVDTCGNDITDNIGITGNYDFSKPGIYTVTYTVTDLLNKTISVSANITVADNAEETEPAEVTTTRKTSKNDKNDDDDNYNYTKEYTTTAAPETTTLPPETTWQTTTVAPETTTQEQTTTEPPTTTETTTEETTTPEQTTTSDDNNGDKKDDSSKTSE